MDAGGDGGLSLGLEMKEYKLYHKTFTSKGMAEKEVAYKFNLFIEETDITTNAKGEFVIWFRYRT